MVVFVGMVVRRVFVVVVRRVLVVRIVVVAVRMVEVGMMAGVL